MLRSLKDLERYTVRATDGDIGEVVTFLLDDQKWIIRYLVVQAGGHLFLDGRRVLISPISFRQVDWSGRRFDLTLTSDKVRKSPGIDVDEPVSRQHERDYYGYYGYPLYWQHSGIWGMGAYPGFLAADDWDSRSVQDVDRAADVHLRSAKEVRGYHVQGSDGGIGHIEDMVVDDESWHVRYLVVDTSNWWFGKKVLLSPHWASRISWEERKVYVDMSRRAIQGSPEWNGLAGVTRDFERLLHEHFERSGHWQAGGTL
jgi:sporulation protein YlmC with PRC-barrel domain